MFERGTKTVGQDAITFQGKMGDNGVSAWVAIATLGLVLPFRTCGEVVLHCPYAAGDGVRVEARVSSHTQLLYVIPIITRDEACEVNLIERIEARSRGK